MKSSKLGRETRTVKYVPASIMRFLTSLLIWAAAAAPVYGQYTYVQLGWTAFGDSFSAGPGAGGDYGGSGDCRRRTGAWPSQLDRSTVLSTNPAHDFEFAACSGARIADVLHKTTNDGQIDAFRDNTANFRDFATISIGGNDVGFSNTLDACVFHAQRTDCPLKFDLFLPLFSCLGSSRGQSCSRTTPFTPKREIVG